MLAKTKNTTLPSNFLVLTWRVASIFYCNFVACGCKEIVILKVPMPAAVKVGMGAIPPILGACRIFVNEYTCGDTSSL